MAADRVTRILLLTSAEEAPLLADILRSYNRALEVIGLHDKAAVEQACAKASAGTRLISFCSPVIVSGAALAALPGPAYNFHPGPPNRPGRYPSIFAIYDGDPRFGVTVHEMAAKVDSGAIVAAEWFDVAPDSDLAALEEVTYLRLAAVFRKLARHLASQISPLPHLAHVWSGRKTTLAHATALAETTPDMTAAEVERRRRACGRTTPVTSDPGWPT